MEIIRPGTNIDFIGRRRTFGAISGGLVAASIVLMIIIGPNYGIDFKGGTNIIVRFNEPVDDAAVTGAMVNLGFVDAVVQSFGPAAENQFLIQTNRISVISRDQADHIRETLVGEFGQDGLDFDYNEDSGDRIEVRLPEGAFEDLPNDWRPPTADAAQGTGDGTGDGSGTGSAVYDALFGWMSEWNSGDLEDLRDEAARIGIHLEDPAERDSIRRQANMLGLTMVIDALDAIDAEESADAERISPQRAYLQYILSAGGLENAQVSQVGNPRQRRFLIRLQQIHGRVQEGLSAAFGAQFDQVQRVETVGPRVGEQLRDDGIKAVVLSLFFILVYIGLRFNMRFAPGAVVALFHDVLITLGILTLIREEITLTILAALLTIVGYSLNDTIVVFDRIRENLGALRSKDLPTVVNQSINETLSRTVLTSLTTLLAVLAIYFLGGGLIKSFALAMIIGIVVGTYSSIYVASPMMILIHNRLEARAAKQREEKKRSGSRRGATARRSP